MGSVLVYIETVAGKVQKGSLCTLTAAMELKSVWGCSAVNGIVLGDEEAAQGCKELGLDTVYTVDSEVFKKYISGIYAEAFEEVINRSGADVVVLPASSNGKDLAPRIAAKMEAGQGSEILSVNPDGSLKRPMYAGNVIADVEILTAKKVVTVRTTAFAPAQQSSTVQTKIEKVEVTPSKSYGEIVGYDKAASARPELGDAEVVVSGGRALKSAENFMKVMGELADVFGAAIGASRAAVDSGYAPNDWQVGQTGKVVAPNLYIAVGISGAIQHLAGMKDSKVVVAINKDPDAPIFEIADYGLVADLYEAVPTLIEEVKKVKNG